MELWVIEVYTLYLMIYHINCGQVTRVQFVLLTSQVTYFCTDALANPWHKNL